MIGQDFSSVWSDFNNWKIKQSKVGKRHNGIWN